MPATSFSDSAIAANESMKNCGLKQRFASRIPPQIREPRLHGFEASEHFRNGCDMPNLTEGIAQPAHDTLRRSVMNLRIDAVHIAG